MCFYRLYARKPWCPKILCMFDRHLEQITIIVSPKNQVEHNNSSLTMITTKKGDYLLHKYTNKQSRVSGETYYLNLIRVSWQLNLADYY